MDSVLEQKSENKISYQDENRFAHIAEKNSVTEGYVLGTPVVALCGEVFVPSRDPEKFPICPICIKLAELLFFSPE